MGNRDADVVVIGAGPAGTTAAIRLRQAAPQTRVVVVERAAFPRPHVGESTLPDAGPVLARLGVLDRIRAAGFRPKGGITYKWRPSSAPFFEQFAGPDDLGGLGGSGGDPPPFSWQVDRARYDQILLERALELGAEVRQPATVRRVLRAGDRVVGVAVDNATGLEELRCRHVIDASGQARLVARELGLHAAPQDLGDLAIYRYLETDHWPTAVLGDPQVSRIFFAATDAGWIWYIPLAGARVSVGVVTRRDRVADRSPEAVWDDEVGSVAEIAEALADARPAAVPGGDDTGIQVTQNWSYAHDVVAGPGWYAVGDAAAFVDPILSSGILVAHRTGLAAAHAVLTEWDETFDADRILAEYQGFQQDLVRGFVTMARWWYHQRDADLRSWWDVARDLVEPNANTVDVTSLDAFMYFAAGYLTDHRLRRIGPAFGVSGLAHCIDGLTGSTGAGPRLRGEVTGRSAVVVRRYRSVRCERYLGTAVETDRWWELPAYVFDLGDETRVYRPAVSWDSAGIPDPMAIRRAVVSLLDAAGPPLGLDDLIARAQSSEDSSAGRAVVARVAADLIALGVFAVDDAHSSIGSGAPALPELTVALCRSTHDAELTQSPSVDPSLVPDPIVTLEVRADDGPSLQYRPPPSQSDPMLAWAVLTCILGQTTRRGRPPTVETIIQGARLALDSAPTRAVHDLASAIVADLLGLGLLVRASGAEALGV